MIRARSRIQGCHPKAISLLRKAGSSRSIRRVNQTQPTGLRFLQNFHADSTEDNTKDNVVKKERNELHRQQYGDNHQLQLQQTDSGTTSAKKSHRKRAKSTIRAHSKRACRNDDAGSGNYSNSSVIVDDSVLVSPKYSTSAALPTASSSATCMQPTLPVTQGSPGPSSNGMPSGTSISNGTVLLSGTLSQPGCLLDPMNKIFPFPVPEVFIYRHPAQ